MLSQKSLLLMSNKVTIKVLNFLRKILKEEWFFKTRESYLRKNLPTLFKLLHRQ
jgi:hypothetical protein